MKSQSESLLSKCSALTVDVEDAVNQAMRKYFHTEMEPTYRVVNNTLKLLDLFDEFNASATFFILGEVAATYPDLIKEISVRGHELGIHGYYHLRYYEITREQARSEIVRSKKLIEDITGNQVIGHRAPEFSVNQNTKWVLEILLDEGIKYDSSIFPINGRRYGWPDFSKDIGKIKLDDGREIIEAPLTTVNYFGKEFPSCGGGYLRIFPYFITNHTVRRTLNYRPVNVYLHPYEIDPPPFQDFYMDAIRKSSLQNKLQLKAYWLNRTSVFPKLRRLLAKYNFNTLQEVINNTINTDL